MYTCKYCGKPLTLTPEFDTCMECQGEQLRKLTLPIVDSIASNKTVIITKDEFKDIEKFSWANIYDEAIEKLKSVMAKFIIPSVEDSDYGCLYDRCHFYNSLDEEEDKWLRNVYKALERAKKVEELLGLYQYYFEINQIQVLNGGHAFGDSRKTKESIDCILSINIKKKELEKMK